jgi:hypothetical protein
MNVNVEDRFQALEKRLRAAEDQLEILRLLNSYGPLVDSGSGQEASQLWVADGHYDAGGAPRFTPSELVSMYADSGHMGLVNTGCSHLTATPRITVDGDGASAVAYSFVVLKEDDRWYIFRAAINHWTLTRTDQGWRIVERFNRVLDGSPESHDVMRKVLVA